MKINGLYPENFGKLKQKEYTFSDGINLIQGDNEAGKSTLRQFLTSMLFGLTKSRARDDLFTKYKPWDTPGAYRGAMDIEVNGVSYRVIRDFLGDGEPLQVLEYPSMREVPVTGELLAALGSGLTKSGYLNTVSVAQGGIAPNDELAPMLTDYLTNLSTSREQDLNVNGALDVLLQKKKLLDRKNLPEKEEQLARRLDTLTAQQNELERKAEQLTARKYERDKIGEQLEILSEEAELTEEHTFSDCKREYEAYLEQLSKRDRMEEDLQERRTLRDNLARTVRSVEAIDAREEELDELLRRKASADAKAEYERSETEARLKRVTQEKKRLVWPALAAGLLLAAAVFFAIVAVTGCLRIPGIAVWLTVATVLGITALGGTLLMRRKLNTRQKKLNDRLTGLMSGETAEQRELAALIAALPTEDELHDERDRAIADRTRLSATEEQIAEKETELMALEAELDAERETLLSKFRAFEPIPELTGSQVNAIQSHLLARSVQCRNRKADLARERDSLTEMIARLSQQVEDGASLETELAETERDLEECRKEAEHDRTEMLALCLAMDTIEALARDIHDSFGRKLNETLSEQANRITAGAYRKLAADEKLTVRTGNSYRATDITKLSSGTTEQLYLALRLAVSDIMYEDEHLPLVFDDSFVYYDRSRLSSTLSMLAETNRQVLIFTCSDRERELLTELKIPYHTVEMNSR